MTVKESYKIPETLDKSFGDMEIAIQSTSGVGVRPLSVKLILGILCSAFLCFYCVANTFINAGGPFLIVCFIILWIALSIILLRPTGTGQMYIQIIPTMLSYIQKGARRITTRRNSNVNGFFSVVGIDDVDEDTGLVSYSDGTFAFVYRVVGSASVLLFDSDRDAIINRVDAFFRKMREDYELIFLTVKEAQNVREPLRHLKERYDALENKDPELVQLYQMQQGYLKNCVGTEFRSIHQYLIVKADNKEALITAKNLLESEVGNSTLMFKQCKALFGDDIYDVLRSVYMGKESV